MIRRFMDCSAGHLSPDTWAWLDAHLGEDRVRDPYDRIAGAIAGGRTRHGWFVHAPEEPDPALPAELERICRHARRRGAEYVLFDNDAIPDQELPVLHPEFLPAS